MHKNEETPKPECEELRLVMMSRVLSLLAGVQVFSSYDFSLM